MKKGLEISKKLAHRLILDELFDFTLYKSLYKNSTGDIRKLLAKLIPIEEKHYDFWQAFFGIRISKLNFARRIKLFMLLLLCRFFGTRAIHLVLESLEIYGIRKYLAVWNVYKKTPLSNAVRGILEDEFKHEDEVVLQQIKRKVNPERIRSIFLGFNDGLVEILGAVSGFFAAFTNTSSVLIAGSTVAVAGSLSMAAGSYVASSSEKEVKKLERSREQFLGSSRKIDIGEKSLNSAFIVGISYIIGAIIPMLPVIFGSSSILASVITAGSMIILVSLILAFLSGMDVKRRILINLVIIAAAVFVTYTIGIVARDIWGISI